MNNSRSSSFLEPVISVLGLVISLATAILPLFNLGVITNLFIIPSIALPISFLSFMLGIAAFWIINQVQFLMPNLSFGPIDSQTGLRKYNLTNTQTLLLILVFCAIFGFCFFVLKQFTYIDSWYVVMGALQGLLYLLFFVFLISLFSLLYKQTNSFYTYQQQRENFSSQITETLERNGILKPRIEILENIQMTYQEIQQYGISSIFVAKKVSIREKGRSSTYIFTIDGKELIKKV